MSIEKLEKQRSDLQAIIQEAQKALDIAKVRSKKHKEFADAEWFTKTKIIIREKTNELHAVSRQIKDYQRKHFSELEEALRFQKSAKTLLSSDKYEEINAFADKNLHKEIL